MSTQPADPDSKVAKETHNYQPPGEGASRSVCPALNTMANHGYIHRDGKNISMLETYRGLKACWGLSSPLAGLLALGGWFAIRRLGRINLFDIGLHNAIEHDASVVHLDCPAGQKYAPIEIQQDLVEEFVVHAMKAASAAAGRRIAEADILVTQQDMVQTRIRREKLSPPLDSFHADLGCGELVAIFGIWSRTVDGKQGVPLSWIRTWFATEKLPDGWSPDHVETLRAVLKGIRAMKAEMKKIRDEEVTAAAGSQ
ncbi:putative sterigmatocystin biosynthesis peroxidase stcC [Mycena venus]|uniref:Putative sterigmatocystin biosynthesis peroxidase stcC n=1 Tax=Mycena venus TaxID=2733690 RepID=A0A8H7DE39_9AGAR|nr:putative sterigmatocystin biosynthesis peroxidase stcC [Mycena venus]